MTFSPDSEVLDLDTLFSATREMFYLPINEAGLPKTYLCGNSLGLQPKAARQVVERELQRWAELGIDGYFAGDTAWVRFADLCTPELARLTGSQADEVVLMNSLTTNLHLLMVSFYRPAGARRKILIEQQAFPTDAYAMASQIQWHGGDPENDLVVLEPDQADGVFSTEHIVETIEKQADELALVLLPAVQYVSGQVLDVAAITRAAHQRGVLIGWDCAHAAGNIPLSLHDWQVDFAVGCTYKYLNGGPGAPGWAFVHQNHHPTAQPRLQGWWGNRPETRFQMAPEFEAAAGVNGWQLSNVPVLAAAAVLASLQVFSDVPLTALRQQSLRLHAALRHVMAEHPEIAVLTPADPSQHGCQLAFRHRSGRNASRALFEHLQAEDIIGDWREPGIIRLSPVPLYNSLADITAVQQSLQRFFAG
jgi:kynureninase